MIVRTPPVRSASVIAGLPIPRLPKALLFPAPPLQFTFSPGEAGPDPELPFSMSTPRPPLSWIELAPIVFSLQFLEAPASLLSRIPSTALKAISFWSAGVVYVRSPMSICFVSWCDCDTIVIPSRSLPRSIPTELVPIELPVITCASVACSQMPEPEFPPMRLSSMVM